MIIGAAVTATAFGLTSAAAGAGAASASVCIGVGTTRSAIASPTRSMRRTGEVMMFLRVSLEGR